MAKNSPLNIFHAAAKIKKPLTSESKGTKVLNAPPVRNVAIEAMLERMNEMRKEIDDKLEALMCNNGLSKDRLQEFLKNPQNFTKEQWQFLQQKNEEFSQKIWSAVDSVEGLSPGINSHSESKTDYHESSGPASTATMTGRKSKFAGSRRNWIPTG